MSNHTCKSCRTTVRYGEAVIRSESLARVFYHRHCWEKVHGPLLVGSAA